MKIPRRILERVGAPILATAALSCSSTSVDESPPPQPISPVPLAAEAPSDPVEYDAVAEAERFARTDQLLAEVETDRDRRIEDGEAARRRRSGGDAIGIGLIGSDPHWLAACGRG